MGKRWISALYVAAIVASILALRGVPILRERVGGLGDSSFPGVNLLPVAEANPSDATVWLAVLASSTSLQLKHDELARAYARARKLSPDSAAADYWYAVRAMPRRRQRRAELEALYGEYCDWLTEEPLTDEEQAALAAAEAALARAAQTDPANAAIDSLLASASLLAHRDEEARAHMQRALAKSSWTRYGPAARTAVLHAGLRVMPEFEASGLARNQPTLMYEIDLARTLAGQAVLAARRGDHQEAILLRESLIHLADLMLRNAQDTLDLMTAELIWMIATAPEPSPAPNAVETTDSGDSIAPLEDDEEGPAGGYYPPQAHIVAAYFHQHGRDDLADRLTTLGPAFRVAHMRYQAHREQLRSQAEELSQPFRVLGWLTSAFLGCLLVSLTAGAVALLLRLLRRSVLTPRWPARTWILILGVSGLGAVGACLLWGDALLMRTSPLWAKLQDVGQLLGGEPFRLPLRQLPWGDFFALVGLPLFIVLTLLAALRYSRSRDARSSAGLAGLWVGAMLAVVLPLTALLGLGTVGAAYAAATAAERQATINQAIIDEGEVAYFGLLGDPPFRLE
ncbi:MAG: hypothetical protein MUQ65_06310 [Armatimonadetes bacterium]|nr:hypothetical protein [Armatimonadota bacterium]